MELTPKSLEDTEDRANIAVSSRDYTFREAGDHDFRGIEALFEQKGKGRGWAVWKYRKNPDGRARVFIVEDPGKTIVGTLAYLPRRFAIAGRGTLTVMQVVDIFLTAELRENRVFLGLLEFGRRHIREARIGVPNQFSSIFGSGPGWRVLGYYETWQFPVLIGGLLVGGTYAFAAPLLNVLSRIYLSAWLPGKHRDLEMRQISRFCRDYALDSAVNHGVRSADYLNWRFVDNPIGNYQVYEFVEKNETVGYCVFTRSDSTAKLSEFVATRRRRGCMRRLIEHCRETEFARISYSGTGLRLGSLGFIRHGYRHDCVAYKLPEGQWFVTGCDIDSEPGRTPLASGQAP